MAKGRKGIGIKGLRGISWTLVLAILVAMLAGGVLFQLYTHFEQTKANSNADRILVIQTPPQSQPQLTQAIKPDLYPEPVTRLLGGGFPSVSVRGGRNAPIQQVGILTGEGGSSSSAAPDRTILPLYGRELDPRRSKWNYYTRTDGTNPVQVPVRVGNRVCDDDTNGCTEVYDDDSVHVPALGRSFKATIYRRTLF